MTKARAIAVAAMGVLSASCSRASSPASAPAPDAPSVAVSATFDAGAREASAKSSNGTWKRFPPAPPEVRGKMLVAAYEDFGPQALAGTFLGEECYPFGACCCSEPGDRFDVRVVVVDGPATEAAAKARYPTGPETGDYRVVTKAAALVFLRASLADLRASAPEDRIPTLEATLAATESRIVAAFAP